jgi:uncharacterized protein YaeQ
MALKATVYKADLRIADLDRNYYAEHRLTLAREGSETDERMMVRLLAFALNADPSLALARGMTEADEPDLWLKDLEGRIRLWIEVGLPDERSLRKAAGRADEVLLYLYHGRQARLWWEQNRGALASLRNLRVVEVDPESVKALAALAAKAMDFQCTIQEGQAWIADGEGNHEIRCAVLS